MRTLSIDIETFSSNDIKFGVHKYVDANDFEILLFAYAFDNEPVKIIDFTAGGVLPPEVVTALADKEVIKTAFNAAFEITCLSKVYPDLIKREQWECTSVLALYNSLPPGLGPTAKALGFEEDKQKDTRGKALIRFFCLPCKPTKTNGGRTRNLPEHDREKWETFKEYCKQDVVVERAIRQQIITNSPGMSEHRLWLLDQRINDCGVKIDRVLVDNAIRFNVDYSTRLTMKLKRLTRLSNPNSVSQLKGWVEKQLDMEIPGLDKAAVAELLTKDLPNNVRMALRYRAKISKTSVKKYEAMANSVCSDGRIHDLFQFYGSRTGRWAGRNVQLQNLPRNYMPDLDEARNCVKAGNLDVMDLLYDDIPDVLSQLIRTALVADAGKRFIVADFSAIEARVIAWLAGETWRQEVFANGGDIYCASASAMFGVPVVKNGINGHLRQKGKVAELALGYQGGPGALIAMGALDMGLSEEELPDIVYKWREASPHIVAFWSGLERAAMNAIKYNEDNYFSFRGIKFYMQDGNLMMVLPTGRCLCYRDAAIGVNRFDNPSITYKGLNQVTRQWTTLETYGGKLVENCVQAAARDCLGSAMLRLDKAGYKIVGHIHDEVILETPEGKGSLDEAIKIMTENRIWNEGLKMDAAGFENPYYMKD